MEDAAACPLDRLDDELLLHVLFLSSSALELEDVLHVSRQVMSARGVLCGGAHGARCSPPPASQPASQQPAQLARRW